MHLHGDEHEAEDEPRQHGEHAQHHAAPEPDPELGHDDAAPTRFGEKRRGHCLVPVLTRDDDHAEDQGEDPRDVEHGEHVDEPLGRTVRNDAGAAAVSAAGSQREAEAEREVDQHDDAEEHIGRPDRPELADLGFEQPGHH